MLRELMDRLRGQEKADGEVGASGQVKICGVADDQRTGWDGDLGASAKGKARGGDKVDGAAALADGRVCRANGKRVGAELVGEDDTKLRAADGDVYDLAQGSVGESVGGQGRTSASIRCGYGGGWNSRWSCGRRCRGWT